MKQLGRFYLNRYYGHTGQTVSMPKDAKVIGIEHNNKTNDLQVLILQESGVIEYVNRHFMVWGQGEWVNFPDTSKDVVTIGSYIENERTYTVAEVIE